jgi:protein disulfide-isomerase A4
LADQHGIGGWPMFKLFRKGRVFDYNGPREKQNIVDFMKGQSKPPSEEKNHMLGITNNMDRTEVTVVGYFNGKSDLYDEYVVAANEMRGTFKFMHSFDADVAKSFDVAQESIVVYMPEIFWTQYENKTHTLTKKSATYKEIISFIRTNSVPLVGWRNKRNEFKYHERPLVVIYYDVNYDHQFTKDTQYIRNKVVLVARNFLGSNLRFAISNEEEYAEEIKSLGFEDSGADVNIGCFSEKQKFRMKVTDEFEPEDLGEFIEDLRLGKVMPYMKSLPVPKSQEGQQVLKLVANNYDKEVHRVKKDAVVFFHAPWCGHCKEFDLIFKKIAKKMKVTNDNIVFGKFDATVNDVPYMFPPLKGYPSIFFLSAYEKFDPIQYQGDRTYKSVKDWINRHSSIFLSEEERTGQAADDDEEIESFTAENFEADVATNDEPKTETGKDEL